MDDDDDDYGALPWQKALDCTKDYLKRLLKQAHLEIRSRH
jgi:hypothetical protein